MATPLYQAKAEFFWTLGHPARIRILELLSERDHAVHQLLDPSSSRFLGAPARDATRSSRVRLSTRSPLLRFVTC